MLKKGLLIEILFSMAFAFLVSTFIYFSFSNVYSAPLINYKNFAEQYSTGIYQYRFLSNWFLIQLYEFFNAHPVNFSIKFYFWNKNAEPAMYLAYFVLNTFFLCLTAALIAIILNSKKFIPTRAEKILVLVAVVFAIAVSQFVLVPYDTSSYFFLMLFLWIYINFPPEKNISNLLLLSFILALSAINRETAALSIALSATLLFTRYGFKKKAIYPIFSFAIVYMAVYIGIRLYFGVFSTNDGSLFLANFTNTRGYLGMVYWILFFFISWYIASKENRKLILIFHFFAIPYILMCFYTGSLYEIRLYVPLFISSLMLAFYRKNSLETNS